MKQLSFSLQFSSGFSLIELMVAIAIMGILTSIAMPAYQDYVHTGNATEATANLSNCRIQAENYFQDNLSYEGFTIGTSANDACRISDTRYFTYSTPVATATAYTLQATGITTEGMANIEFTINQDNVKTSKFGSSTSASCWLTSENGAC